MKIPVYNQKGERSDDIEVSDVVFGAAKNDALLSQAVMVLSGNLREGLSHTKGRGERAGSGRKPWRQKGTGRARVGSVRSPLWRGGGIIFGPKKEQNYKRLLPVKMRRRATAVALSEKVRSENIFIIESFQFSETKTRLFLNILKKLNITQRVLVGFGAGEMNARRMCKNIPRVSDALAQDINVRDILSSKVVVLSKSAVSDLEKRLA